MPSAESRLFALPRFAHETAAYRPGLERTAALLAALGDPHRAFPTIHVAGTNGKGSTASLAASVAEAAGLVVGLHTSPHLLSVRERMRVGGAPASAEWLETAVERLAPVLDEIGPSFFEATVALSLLYFAERNVDLAVVEVGLGGRLDATNLVEPSVSVVTHVGLDHTDLLGETVVEIGREKAGIARRGIPLLHAVVGLAAHEVEAEAVRLGASVEAVRGTCAVEVAEASPLRVRLATPVADYGEVAVGLPGRHQAWNAALAVRAVEVAHGAELTPSAVRAGLAEVVARSGLRGRGEALADGRIVLDVAHNADGWRAALAALAVPPGGRLWALVGVMADKDAGALADVLARAGARALAVGLDGDRALPAEALSGVLRARGVPAVVVVDASAALAAFAASAGPDDRMLVTGSHVTVAEALVRTPSQEGG
ncbi:bifunctional folylpolyglutamate synthase/dihydrofolate synthase [Rubrivirga sp. IMCC43871]|uniref:bifunctional folylpolyglutamate synthase/dihydrofolate synthase n=1 Tax=Rubrivirga sp. IMCC43871 TaxID=3391575 RepID=UPI00398FB52A